MQNEYQIGQSDLRPWGKWQVVDVGGGFTVKRITVNSGCKLSLQRHQYRSENWVVVSGVALITLGKDKDNLTCVEKKVGETVFIKAGDIHRVENKGNNDLVFIEVQTGDILIESDIERLEDIYSRI